MQESHVINQSKIQKYKKLYLQSYNEVPKEDMIQQIVELKLLQNDFQNQKDELQRSQILNSQLTKVSNKLKEKYSELQNQLQNCQNQLKHAIQSRDVAIGQKYIMQKKFESTRSAQELYTEPSICKQPACSQEMRTESNGIEENDQNQFQISELESKLVQVKIENGQLKQQLEDCQIEHQECQNIIKDQQQIINSLKKFMEIQTKKSIDISQITNNSFNFSSTGSPRIQQIQEQQIKKLIRNVQSTSCGSLPTLKNAASLNQKILEKQLMNQIKFQEILEQSEDQQDQIDYSLTSREEIRRKGSDFSNMFLNVLNISPTNDQISKKRIQTYFGKDQQKPKESRKWF